MSPFADSFWKTVGDWERDQPGIVLDFSLQSPPMAMAYTRVVIEVAGKSVSFCDAATGVERTLSFEGAEIRFHSFERIDSVGSFAVRWDEGLQAVNCFLTEHASLE